MGNDSAGTVLVLYHLQRQHYSEALQAFEALRPVSGRLSIASALRAAFLLDRDCGLLFIWACSV